MPVEMGMWRIDEGVPRRLTSAMLPSERTLEDFLEQDPTLLGHRLLVIGRQVRTPHGKYIDLIAIDDEANLHVLELKRDRTPRDVVAQVLDYGSWVTTLGRDEVIAMANDHLGSRGPFEVAFEGAFQTAPPDELNSDQRLTVVATGLDSSSERIIEYLAGFGVPINAVFFSFMQDEDRSYLARSWLISGEDADSAPGRRVSKRADWNGKDWFVSFGDSLGRSWADGLRYGFVSAGGGQWFSNTLRALPVGARVFVHVPKAGYVAVGETLRPAERFDAAEVWIDGTWTKLAGLHLEAAYRHVDDPRDVDDENAEYVVPVRWIRAVGIDEAYWEKGMFANQNSACKLRQQFTLERLAAHFELDGDV
ncbi:hypothetical protein [Actinotalea sp. C106]|uniref:hypothetical protein n=1 Tax=Actinotalea sp. C106 TaxID=2908644 RepID=UPI002028A8A8|nr:hypothetical protein [Actinotalea sp. C106]